MGHHRASLACHSASRMYSLAMPSKARSRSCLTASVAHASGFGAAGDAVTFSMHSFFVEPTDNF